MNMAASERTRAVAQMLRRTVEAAAERARSNRYRRHGQGGIPDGWAPRRREAVVKGWPGRPAGDDTRVVDTPETVNREREVKLDAPNDFVLPRLDGVGGLRVLADEDVDLDAEYYDTDDLRLTRAGMSLRYRSDDGWTAKLPVAVRSAFLDRAEHLIPGGPGEPPREAKDLVGAWIRSAPLRVIGRLQTHRRRVRLGQRPGVTDVEVADDRVVASMPGTGRSQFREIEVEFGPHASKKARQAVVARLRSAGARTGDKLPKIARAVGRRATAAPDVAPPKAPGKRSRVRDVVQASIASSLHRLVSHDPAVRIGNDPEAVHQARVATRRLRSDLRTFRLVVDRSITEPLRDELKWLGSKLGAVRDIDVLTELLQAKLALLGEPDAAPAGDLLRELERARREAHDELVEVMRGARYARLLDRLVAAARRPPVAGKAAKRRAASVVPKLVRRPWHQLSQTVKALPRSPSDTELHEVRKRAKQARYAAEAVSTIAGRPARDFAKAMARLQDVLGAHQDAVVARSWLRDAVRKSDNQEVVFLAGELAGVFATERQVQREAWRAEWQRARSKKLRRWF
jgi:CHAD domain-containing protein